MTLRAETRVDRSTAAIAVERSARDGVVHLRVPLTWIGVRTYRDATTGKLTRELRRPEQVWAPSHIETLKRLTCTHGHPSERWEGAVLPVMLDARADAMTGPDETGTLRRPPASLQVGQTGDLIDKVEIDGAALPVAGVAIHGAAAIADIEAGKTQTSLGYGCLVDHTPGTWTDSGGRTWDYDAEHVLDVDDPRVVAAVAEGFDPATLGANHLAVAIARGRGGPMSELLPRLDGACLWEVVADGVSTMRVPPRLLAAMESAGVTSTVKGPVPAALPTTPLTGTYDAAGTRAHKWLGWLEHGDGIAFVDIESAGLWWAVRLPSGAVAGEPVAFSWSGPSRVDADPPAVRDDLGEPRLFSMVRNADESGVSGTGRVLDGVLWPDGTVVVRWRTATPSDGGFDSWTHFHSVHVCAHPTNETELPFADGEEAPPCVACKARDAVAAARTMGDEDDANEAPAGAPYPFGVRTISLPARARVIADKVAPLLGSKVSVKSDASLELNLPPEMSAPFADALMALAEQIKAMGGELLEADAALGTQSAELATAKEAVAKMQADAALVAPLLADARKAKRDALVVEATRVAGGKFDADDAMDEAAIKKAAVAKRLPTFPRLDSVDAVDAAFLALATAGGKDPADKPQPDKKADALIPLPERKPNDAKPEQRPEQRTDSHKPSDLYDDGE